MRSLRTKLYHYPFLGRCGGGALIVHKWIKLSTPVLLCTVTVFSGFQSSPHQKAMGHDAAPRFHAVPRRDRLEPRR